MPHLSRHMSRVTTTLEIRSLTGVPSDYRHSGALGSYVPTRLELEYSIYIVLTPLRSLRNFIHTARIPISTTMDNVSACRSPRMVKAVIAINGDFHIGFNNEDFFAVLNNFARNLEELQLTLHQPWKHARWITNTIRLPRLRSFAFALQQSCKVNEDMINHLDQTVLGPHCKLILHLPGLSTGDATKLSRGLLARNTFAEITLCNIEPDCFDDMTSNIQGNPLILKREIEQPIMNLLD
jgi:hypothetical protein